MKTHSLRKLLLATAILATTLPASFNLVALAQTATNPANTTQQVTVTPAATYFSVSGNAGKFMQDMGTRDGLAAGIQDFTLTRQIDDKTRVEFDGRAIFGNKDYLIDFKFQQDDLFKVDLGYKQFYTPYNADGLYFTYNGATAFGSDKAGVSNAMGVTRGTLWLDIQTLLPSLPAFTLHVDHSTRSGDAGSTIMASYAFPASAGVTNNNRGILPAYYHIDQAITTISLDVDQKLDTLTYGAGIWGQHTTTQDATYSITGVSTTVSGSTLGMGNNTTQDTFGGHAYVTGDIGKHLTYGAGALYNQFEYDINSGGRYYYAGTEQIFDPINRANAKSASYGNLFGESTYKEWSASANLTWRPTKDWSVVPSVSFEDYRTDVASGNFGGSLTNTYPASYYEAGNNWFQATEKLEAHYTGLKNWTHTLSAEFDQGTGKNNYRSYTGLTATNLVPGNPNLTKTVYLPNGTPFYLSGTSNNARGLTNQTLTTTKIAYTANWYVTPGLSFAGQAYYKQDSNDYDSPYYVSGTLAHSSNYPGYIHAQKFETTDINVRMTWRPVTWISNVIRYDYQYSTVDTGYYLTRTGTITATGTTTTTITSDLAQTGKTQTHIISENLTITPHPRVNINLNASLVFDQTALPLNVYLTSNITPNSTQYSSGYQTIINADNNYFNAGINAMWNPTDMDTLTLDYTYYRAWNFVNNARVTVPYGQDETQNTVALAWNRRLTANLSFGLGYIYAQYKNPTQGGKLNYHANGITGNIHYKF